MKWSKKEEEILQNTDFTLLRWEEIQEMFPDKDYGQLINKLLAVGKTEFKLGRIHWREGAPAGVVSWNKKPDFKKMAKMFMEDFLKVSGGGFKDIELDRLGAMWAFCKFCGDQEGTDRYIRQMKDIVEIKKSEINDRKENL